MGSEKKHRGPWLVRIDFLDHVATEGGESHLLPCVVWGVLYRHTRAAYHVCQWSCERQLNGHNSETLTIGRRLVQNIEYIRREKV
jgi:hypothetical protein